MGFFEKLKQGLSKTASSISSVFTASELDDEFYDDLEESLIVSDLGMDTTEAGSAPSCWRMMSQCARSDQISS